MDNIITQLSESLNDISLGEINAVNPSASLGAQGVDSVLRVAFIDHIETMYGIDLGLPEVLPDLTLVELAQIISDLQQ